MQMRRSGRIRLGTYAAAIMGIAAVLLCFGAAAENGQSSDPCEPALDVVFAIDDTGSMGGAIDDIEAALQDIFDIIVVKSGGNYQMGLCTFKDDVEMDVQLAYGNAAAMEAAIVALTATGGAGTPEASDEALNTCINELAARAGSDAFTGSWRPEAIKLIILLTDAPPGGFDDTYTVGTDDRERRYAGR